MPYGLDYPDWGGHYNTGQFYPLFDMAELATRLGSVMSYDRRGALIWWDDFRHGVAGWAVPTGPPASAFNLTADYWERPPFSGELFEGLGDNHTVLITRQLEVPQATNVGVQISALFGTDCGWLELRWRQYTGTYLYTLILGADPIGQRIRLTSAEGTTTLLSTTGDFRDAGYFLHLKLVFDMETHLPVRLLALEEEIDISAYTMSVTGDNSPPMLEIGIEHYSGAPAETSIYIDNVIVTAAEPAN